MSINAFTPQGSTCLQTANIAGALPTPIQVPSFGSTVYFNDGMMVVNLGTNNVFLGYGATAALATANAVIPIGIGANSTATILVPASSALWVRIPPGSFLCGITAAGTSAVYFTPGEGS